MTVAMMVVEQLVYVWAGSQGDGGGRGISGTFELDRQGKQYNVMLSEKSGSMCCLYTCFLAFMHTL